MKKPTLCCCFTWIVFFECKVELSPSKKISIYLLQWKSFKNYEKCFLFHLKSSFCSQDIKFLPRHFGHVEETA